MAAAAAVKEALWLSKLLRDLQLSGGSVAIMCDNQAALKLLQNPIASNRSKHIDVHHHFARERAARGEVQFEYCSTDSMVADIMTKALPAVKFGFCQQGMGPAQPPAALADEASATARAQHAAAVQAAAQDAVQDQKAKAVLAKHVADHHLHTIKTAATAKAAWDALKAQFEQQTVARQAQLDDQLHALSKRDTETIMQFLSRTRQLWADLTAAKCNTNEQQVVRRVFSALPPSYAPIVQILKFGRDSSSALTLDSIQQDLVQWEQDLLQQDSQPPPSLMAMGSRGGRGRGATARYGLGVGKGVIPTAEHNAGPPPNRAGGKGVCHYCGKAGHFKAECRKRIRDQGQASGGRGGGSRGAGGAGASGSASSSSTVFNASLFSCVASPPAAPPAAAAAACSPIVAGFTPASSPDQFIIDSGASRHVVRDASVLFNYSNLSPPVTMNLGKAGAQMQAVGHGTVHVSTAQGNFSMGSVLHVPDAAANFISVSAATDSHCRVVFEGDKCELQGKGPLQGFRLSAAKSPGGMYAVTGTPMLAPAASHLQDAMPAVCSAASPPAVSPQVWHMRTGHASYSVLSNMQRKGLVHGVGVTAEQFAAAGSSSGVCGGCALGKQHRRVAVPLPNNAPPVTRPLGLVHMDVCGPMRTAARDGSRYFATFLDELTSLSVVVMLKQKSDVPNAVMHVVQLLEKQSGHQVRVLRSDNGSEYFNSKLSSWCSSKGIRQEHSAPYSPEQNGRAERLNRTLVECARSMLHWAGLGLVNWGDAIRTACYLRNLLPVTGQRLTPWEAFWGVKPDLSWLRVFGCTVWVHVPQVNRSKLDAKSQPGRLVGYEQGAKAYRVLVGTKVVVSKDVLFDERAVCAGEFSSAQVDVGNLDQGPSSAATPVVLPQLPPPPVPPGGGGAAPQLPPPPVPPGGGGAAPQPPPPPVPPGGGGGSSSSSSAGTAPGGGASEQSARSSSASTAGSSSDEGDGGSSSMGSGVGPGPAPAPVPPDPPAARRSLRDRRAPSRYSPDLMASAVDAAESDTPTVAQALAGPRAEQWRQAMLEELAGLHANQTWTLVECPKGAKVLPCMWVLKVKRDAAGSIERFKARLVVKGFHQQLGVDVGEVWAPVSKHSTLRALLVKAAAQDMELHQLDVQAAFLNGRLEPDEVIHMQQPEGFAEGGSSKVCRLQRALYGLRQAPRAWHTRLKQELEAMGFTASQADPSLFTLVRPTGTVWLLVYVDDCLICSSKGDSDSLSFVKQQLSAAFQVKHIGEPELFLGMQISRNRAERTLHLSQPRFVAELVTSHGMADAHPKTVPMSTSTKLSREGTPLDTGQHSFSGLVGSLMYLACCTRPDIAFAVGALARHLAAPTEQHWQAARAVLSFVKGTAGHGLLLGESTALQGYCDADYAGDIDTRRSTTGYVFTMGGTAVSWSSRLQPTVAAATAEAEYMAAAAAVKEALWLSKLLRDLQLSGGSVAIMCDNQAALKLLQNPIASNRSKHIDVHHHFARERAARGEVQFEYCSTDSMVADIMTKALPAVKFGFCQQGMGVFSAA
ncbi:hypothetical protein QJQ45_018125 [Haematococcus lacustris]|nr:hypothetical protein QJQ45_018125 [Haematococcus lacustris]